MDPDLKEGLHRPARHQTHVGGSGPRSTEPVGTDRSEMNEHKEAAVSSKAAKTNYWGSDAEKKDFKTDV